jgi:protein phosphatase
MLRISEHWHASDLGRQRQGNEDNFFVRAPLFAVADGMGGAQAGEVASEMAVECFDAGVGAGSPADALVRIIEEANRRIHERSQSDAQRAGMGTTVTAAYVGEGDVTIAHVGDSRAYLFRDGDLVRLTRDHSLVGELVARGKLTEEQAESHPQRSVITRALGPEPDVEVDIEVFEARPGDVFMLCSDGLTSMVPEGRVKPMLEGAQSLEAAGRELIAAANEAGGRDNITVILFRLESVEEVARGGGEAAAEGETTQLEGVGETAETRVQATDDQEAAYRAQGTVALAPVRPRAEPLEAEPPPPEPSRPPPRRRRRRRVPPALIIAVVGVALVLSAGWAASRAVYFVGVDSERANTVAIYRGLPYELPLGIHLYERYYSSGVPFEAVAPRRRGTFTDHKLRSRDDAESLVSQLEQGQLR